MKSEEPDSFDDTPPGQTKKNEGKAPELKPIDSFPETDSFDEPKGDPIDMEPMFSTASGNRIDVKQESIDKSKRMLTTDSSSKTPSSSSRKSNFTSPFIRKIGESSSSSRPFVSPFRREEPSTSSKRPGPSHDNSDKNGAPPAKKADIPEGNEPKSEVSTSSTRSSSSARKERQKMEADVIGIARINEKKQIRMILQESKTTPLFVGTISVGRGNTIKFRDRLEFEAEIEKKNKDGYPSEVYVEKVLRNGHGEARSDIERHTLADKPFLIKPKFIYELNDIPEIKRTYVQINILDLKIEIYKGCQKCRCQVVPSEGKMYCPKCRSRQPARVQDMVYCRMRVADFSGQIFVNIMTKTTEKFLEMLGYKGIQQWHKFQDPNERSSYVFRPMMLELEKVNGEWEATDVADVNWTVMADYLDERVKKDCK